MTTPMSQVLADAYGTTQANSQEQQEKVAVANAISKLAAADNLDLNTLNEEQLGVVYNHYIQKLAEGEAPPPFPPKKEDEKKDEPEEKEDNGLPPGLSDEEKKAAAELQEADFLGRQMAHSFVNQLGEIQKAAAAQQAAPEQTEVPDVVVKLAQARALEFLQQKVAAGELCSCGNPECNGTHQESKTAAVEPSTQDVIDHYAAEWLEAEGYGRLLQQ